MAPKKKGGKKAADDWEADLGESIDPVAATATNNVETGQETSDKVDGDAAADADGIGGGGLLAALRKNKNKRVKKGKQDYDDFVEGENPPGTESPAPVDLSEKAPMEATFDDEDVFPESINKQTKGGSKKQPAEDEADGDDDGDDGDGGGLKSKKEKEKEKKEREKARKREQVHLSSTVCWHITDVLSRLPKRRLQHPPQPRRKPKCLKLKSKSKLL